MIFGSKMKEAKLFKKWVTKYVLPSIRIHGYYKLKDKCENKMNKLMKDISELQIKNEMLTNELKKDVVYCKGIVYVKEYNEGGILAYRIGKTSNIKTREKLYKTHNLLKKKVVLIYESDCIEKLESCVRNFLKEHKINKKDFYNCSLNKIKKTFELCINSIKCLSCINQKGGHIGTILFNMYKYKEKIDYKIKRINNKIMKYTNNVTKNESIINLVNECL